MTMPRRLPALLLALLITATHAFVAPSNTRHKKIAPLRSSRDEPLFLCEEHVAIALEELKAEYDAVFHQDASLKMSGDVRLEAIEGCDVTLRLFGLFWHSRPVVFGLVPLRAERGRGFRARGGLVPASCRGGATVSLHRSSQGCPVSSRDPRAS